LYSFGGTDGASPSGKLIEASSGQFYGTTTFGGPDFNLSNNLFGYGEIFRITSAGSFAVIHSFASSDGAIPFCGLTRGSDGNFYGTTERGGPSDNGTLFKLLSSGVLVTLHNFAGTDGETPTGVLVQGSDGNLYGTAYAGGSGQTGVVFRSGTIAPVQLLSIVSRKMHGSAGTFDIDLTNGNGIECRSGGASGDYTLVFTFANTLTTVTGATVTSGKGSVVSRNIDSNDAHNYIVNLAGVTNAQVITVSLSNVTDSAGDFSNAVSARLGVLIGDVNASKLVDGNDVSAVQSHTRQPVDRTNFRYDVNANGLIDGNDVSLTQRQTRTSLP
jgi:uncharacterized repeat protein (TIGR03803 family)